MGYSSTQRDKLDSSWGRENGSKDIRKAIITKKGTKKSFTLEEDKLLIRKLLEITNLNVKEIVHQLGQESEISDLRQRTEELEKENIELATNLSKKEQVRHTYH